MIMYIGEKMLIDELYNFKSYQLTCVIGHNISLTLQILPDR